MKAEEDECKRAEIVAALEESGADLAAGRYRDYRVESLRDLAAELKLEGRASLESNKIIRS